MKKLHLGCGNEILEGWVNHDGVGLWGVDVVHDLDVFPWPFASGEFDEVRMFHVLEHLANPVRVMEEIHRITAAGARITIRVPYWNSRDMATDPTHRTSFSEHSFDYFDPSERHCQERPYYSSARFRIARKHYYIKLRGKYRKVSSRWALRLLECAASHLCGVIWVMEFELVATERRAERISDPDPIS